MKAVNELMKAVNELLQVCKGQPQHEEVQLGLLYNILCDMKTDTKTAATVSH